MTTETTLNPADIYALARVLVGEEWQSVPCSPLTRHSLQHGAPNPDNLKALRQLLGAKAIITARKRSVTGWLG